MKKSSMMKLTVTAVVLLFLGSGTFMFAGQDFGSEKPIEYVGDVLNGKAMSGFAVPDYTYANGLNSIENLNDNSYLFEDKVIIGVDAGAGITEAAKKAIHDYGLDFDLQTSSEAGMLGALKTAIEKGNDIVVTLWDPHWAGSTFGMKYLDDPQESFGGAESIEIWTRAGFEDPNIMELLDKYEYDETQFGDLLSCTEEFGAEEGAKRWIEDNRGVVDEWLVNVDSETVRGGVIQIGLVSWACAMASSNVLMHLLKEIGYDARLIYVDTGVMFTGLAYGVTDITTTVWSPGTHAYYLDRYANPDWREIYDARKAAESE